MHGCVFEDVKLTIVVGLRKLRLDLEEIVKSFTHEARGVWMCALKAIMRFYLELDQALESGDLVAYGLIPEFIGRFPILVSSSALNEDQLLQVKLHFTDITLRLIAKKAIAKNTGAKGLRVILENVLVESMFKRFTGYIQCALQDDGSQEATQEKQTMRCNMGLQGSEETTMCTKKGFKLAL
nr:Clp protease regulatory subunit CLPX1, mitochondrial-like isoform X2 [Tanacetum cinerariifolium]